ncbi:hypothetical protein [Actinacidiphila acidipaludis]|uniref:Integral membrane protein n=1 Tax=Actinacidiphila acidipaludis TaxID=2873382 RepID=A0ABS7Q0S2_9ACTN|nr:hypothetical protein [Streptomyces acidipaludis]MBY8876744.1 hypothetical protein [Streptomyces acidipaludis]
MATRADPVPSGDDPDDHHSLDDDERSELAELRVRMRRHRVRSFFSALLITLAAVLAPLSAVSVWVADEIADTDRYVATVAPLASDPDVQAAITAQVTDAVMKKIDLNSLLSNVAPSDRPDLESALGALSDPLNSGLEGFVHQTVASFVASDAFARIWTQLNRQAHAAFVGALTGDSNTAVQVRGDTVTLDLAPVVDQVKNQLAGGGLGVASVIPTVHTDFTLAKSEDIKNVRTGFRILELAGNWLPLVTVVLAVGGVLLAVHRRRAVVTTALAVAVAVAVLGIGLTVFRVVYLNHLPGAANERAAGAVYDQLVRFLRLTIRVVFVLGVVVALGAWLSGQGRWAQWVRGVWESGIAAFRLGLGITSTGAVGRWVRRYRHVLQWAVVAVAVIVMFVWSYPTPVVILCIAIVAVIALAVIEFLDDRRQPPAARVTSP